MFDEIIKYKNSGRVLAVRASHLHQHPEMNSLMHEMFNKFLEQEPNCPENTIILELNMGRVVGKSGCVKTDEKSDVYYAQRRGRKTLSRFVKNVEPTDSETITVIISRNPNKKNQFKLITAYVGYIAEKEPLDGSIKTEEDFLKAKAFWSSHALIDGSQRIYNNTITTECPWDSFDNRPEVKIGNNNDVKAMIEKMRTHQNPQVLETTHKL